jgi:hypothetical protein
MKSLCVFGMINRLDKESGTSTGRHMRPWWDGSSLYCKHEFKQAREKNVRSSEETQNVQHYGS